jgi:hypothetical protein
MKRLFSVAEANALIPHLRGLLHRVQSERLRMTEMKPELEKARDRHMYDWGSTHGTEYVQILDSFQQVMQDIEDLGVLVKDFDLGLCDFPHKREGRVVLLCWKQDEEEVSWWHDLDTGFAGRQPI